MVFGIDIDAFLDHLLADLEIPTSGSGTQCLKVFAEVEGIVLLQDAFLYQFLFIVKASFELVFSQQPLCTHDPVRVAAEKFGYLGISNNKTEGYSEVRSEILSEGGNFVISTSDGNNGDLIRPVSQSGRTLD